jgi:hypothetical protein
MTIKNIILGFRKTSLNPFNPTIVLWQLPLILVSLPYLTIPLEFQTPQNLCQLDFTIKKTQELRQNIVRDHSNNLQVIESKIAKAATVVMAKEEILQCELKEL